MTNIHPDWTHSISMSPRLYKVGWGIIVEQLFVENEPQTKQLYTVTYWDKLHKLTSVTFCLVSVQQLNVTKSSDSQYPVHQELKVAIFMLPCASVGKHIPHFVYLVHTVFVESLSRQITLCKRK